MRKGLVYLVGAGPGDPGLLTVKGLECLKNADVVVYDRLLDSRLLEAVPATAEKIYVGKTSGDHTLPQYEINQILVNKAQEGKTVVRLKGGDPFVFGRGGEEAEILARNALSFEIVPGVTSAVAVPAYAGIPVTHRSIASSFTVVTGHEDPAKQISSINWQHLVSGIDTLVFLMGLSNLRKIVEAMTKHGKASDTPVAVISHGTSPEQQVVTGTLADITHRVEEQALPSPAVIVVGAVVNLRNTLRWFDNRPLSGKRVLVTRARHQASALSHLLAERGAIPVELPSIAIQSIDEPVELDNAIHNLQEYDWLLFTSVNGVTSFWDRLAVLEYDSRKLARLVIGAIGPATSVALADRGISADFIPDTYTTEGILSGLAERNVAGKRFLMPRADIADDTLTRGINDLGAIPHDIAAYRTLPATGAILEAQQQLSCGLIDIVTFTSSSTVTNLLTVYENELLPLKNTVIACIGPKTAETARNAGLKVDVLAEEATIPGLVNAIERYFSEEK